MIRETLILLVCALLAAAGTHYLHPRAPAWYLTEEAIPDDEIGLEEIASRWQGEVLWIDARLREQYVAGHVPGALLLNEQEANELMLEHFEKLQDNQKPVIVYCSGEACQASHKMKTYLKERLPIEEIYVLHGGWKAWSGKHGAGVK